MVGLRGWLRVEVDGSGGEGRREWVWWLIYCVLFGVESLLEDHFRSKYMIHRSSSWYWDGQYLTQQ